MKASLFIPLLFSFLPILAGCKQTEPRYCDEDTPCEDPALPFCDLHGEYPASEGVSNTCIPSPFDAGLLDAMLSDADSVDAGPGTMDANTSTDALLPVDGSPDSAGGCGDPILVGSVTPPDKTFASRYLGGDILATADTTDGMRLVNVANASLPGTVSSYTSTGNTLHLDFAAGSLFLANQDGALEIVDVSNPQSPYQLSTWSPGTDGWVSDVRVIGDYAYVVGLGFSLHVVNVSDPEQPISVGTLAGSACSRIDVENTTAYLACGADGLKIVDASTPQTPTALGSYNPSYNVTAVDAKGGTAYVAANDSGTHVLDVQVPSNIEEIATLPVSNALESQAVSGRVYVASAGEGLVVFDATSYEELDTIPTPDAYDVEIAEQRAYVANFDQPLSIIDLCP